MDLSRLAFALGLVLLAGPALAQDGPLTSLMRPQPLNRPAPLGRTDDLFGENPLANRDLLAGGGSLSSQRPAGRQANVDPANPAKPGDGACDPRTAGTRRPSSGGLAGSGPGEYDRFVNDGRSAEAKPPASAPRRGPGERPLYGGNERPLWGDPAPGAAGAGQAAPRQANTAQANSNGPATGDARVPAAATPGVDRPLWAESGAVRAPADACDAEPGAQRANGATAPTQTLFFGINPAR